MPPIVGSVVERMSLQDGDASAILQRLSTVSRTVGPEDPRLTGPIRISEFAALYAETT